MKLRTLAKRMSMRWQRGWAYAGWTAYSGLPAKQRQSVGDGSSSGVVMAPLQWMMRSFPEAPPTVDRLKGDHDWEQIDDHDLLHLLETPNEHYSGDLLWRATVAQTVLDGNSYWIKIRDDSLAVKELWWVPSCLIEPKWDRESTNFIDYYEYRPGGDPIKVKVDDVVHFRWDIDPNNTRKGLSPLASVLREVFADDEASRFSASLLANMGVPGLIVSPDTDQAIPDEDLEATKLSIIEKTTGVRRGEPMVFGSATKVQQFGFSPQQMDMRTLRKVPEERVTGVLGVAAIVSGLGAGLDRSTFANFKEAREASYEGAIIPLQSLFAAVLRHQLLNDFESDIKTTRVRFDLSQVRSLQEDQNAIVNRKLKELQAGAIPLGQYLRETGRESGPEHEVYLRNFNVVEVRVEDLGKEPDPVVDPLTGLPPVAPPPGAEENPNPAAATDPKKPTPPPAKKSRPDPMQVMLNAEYARSRQHLADAVAGEFLSEFKALGNLAATAFIAEGGVDAHKGLKATRPNDLKDTMAGILTRIDTVRAVGQVRKVLETHYARVADHTESTFKSIYNVDLQIPEHLTAEIVAKGGMRVGLIDVEGNLKDSLFKVMSEGIEQGLSNAQIALNIKDMVPRGRFTHAGAEYRSQMIAESETKWAQNLAAVTTYHQAGVSKVMAFDAQGGPTDAHCMERDGKVFALSQVAGEMVDTHPHCTLTWAPVFA